jgi:hypothetical protein
MLICHIGEFLNVMRYSGILKNFSLTVLLSRNFATISKLSLIHSSPSENSSFLGNSSEIQYNTASTAGNLSEFHRNNVCLQCLSFVIFYITFSKTHHWFVSLLFLFYAAPYNVNTIVFDNTVSKTTYISVFYYSL